MNDPKTAVLRYVTTFAFLLSLVVVSLGAYTRLVDAGLGCPDWPGCYGFLTIPQSEQELAIATERYPTVPVEPAKAWTEMVHRYVATLLGFTILCILGVAVFKRQDIKVPIYLTVLVIAQGIFGAWTVTLKLWPQIVTLHLLGGFATAGLLWYYLQRLGVVQLPNVSPSAKYAVFLTTILLVFQITLGGWTTSNYAALACPDFPLCHGSVLPDMDFVRGFNVLQAIGPNYLGGELSNEARIAIQFSHRIGAILLVVSAIWLAVTLTGQLRWLLGALVGIQFLLGVSNVLFNLPLAVATAHNFGALLILLFMISLHCKLRARSSAG